MEKLPLLQNIENNKLTIIIVDCSDYTQEMILSIQSFILEIPIGSNIAMVCRHGPVSGVRYPNRYCSGNINKKAFGIHHYIATACLVPNSSIHLVTKGSFRIFGKFEKDLKKAQDLTVWTPLTELNTADSFRARSWWNSKNMRVRDISQMCQNYMELPSPKYGNSIFMVLKRIGLSVTE